MFRNPIPFKFATFFLSVFIMMGGWAHADELAQSEFVVGKFFFDPDFDAL